MENAWAEIKDIIPESDPHVRGTINREGGKLEFWLSAPRPKNISVDAWESLQQDKWDSIFGRESCKK